MSFVTSPPFRKEAPRREPFPSLASSPWCPCPVPVRVPVLVPVPLAGVGALPIVGF